MRMIEDVLSYGTFYQLPRKINYNLGSTQKRFQSFPEEYNVGEKKVQCSVGCCVGEVDKKLVNFGRPKNAMEIFCPLFLAHKVRSRTFSLLHSSILALERVFMSAHTADMTAVRVVFISWRCDTMGICNEERETWSARRALPPLKSLYRLVVPGAERLRGTRAGKVALGREREVGQPGLFPREEVGDDVGPVAEGEIQCLYNSSNDFFENNKKLGWATGFNLEL